MSENLHLNMEELPSTEQLEQVLLNFKIYLIFYKLEFFLVELEDLKNQLEMKKSESKKIIHSKMADLHQLIEKWEIRFLDTMNETLDEKIEGVTKQVRNYNEFKK